MPLGRFKETRKEWNGRHQFVTYITGLVYWGGKGGTKSNSIQVNAENTKHMFMCSEKNTGQNHNTETTIRPLNMCKINILATTTTRIIMTCLETLFRAD
jgi:hypothetical protein